MKAAKAELNSFFEQLAREAAAFAPESKPPERRPPPAGGRRTGQLPAREVARVVEGPLRHWEAISVPRFPYVPSAVQSQIARWIRELDAAELLAASGERVLPLLLEGETRCGKTSMASIIGRARGLPAYRLNLAQAIGSHMGETAKAIEGALNEATSRAGLWLVDEIDAVAFRRLSGQGAEQERAHAVGALLTKLEQLPPGLPLIATTNHMENIDPAVLGRFMCVKWPAWEKLEPDERRGFLDAQGGQGVPTLEPQSYADAVKLSREERVEAILSDSGKQLGLDGVG